MSDRSPHALARAINHHLLREAERSRSHDAEDRAIAALARLADVPVEAVHAAVGLKASPEFVEALWNVMEQHDRGQPMMSLAERDPVAAITTEADRRDILSRACRAARLIRRQPDGPGFGHPDVLRKVIASNLAPPLAKEAMLLAREAGMKPSEIGLSSRDVARLNADHMMLPITSGQEESEPDWSIPEDDGRPVDFNVQTDIERIAVVLDFINRSGEWSVISTADARELGFTFVSNWRRMRLRLLDAGLTVEVLSNGRIWIAITPKGRRWLAEQRKAV